MSEVQQVRTTAHEPGREQRVFTFKATQIIWLLLGLLEALFALRFLLKLMAADPSNPFAAMLYGFTDLFLAPFAGLTIAPAAAGMVLETSTVIAMVVYALFGWVLERLVWVIFYRPRGAAAVTQTTVTDQRMP